MKNLYALLIFALFGGLFTGYGQAVEITPSFGYQFGTKLNYPLGYLKFNDGEQYGLTVGYDVEGELVVEVTWIHMDSEMRLRDVDFAPIETRLADVTADWIQFGVNKYLQDDSVKPFLGGGLGFTIFSPSNENFNLVNRALSNTTKFSFFFKGGVNLMISEVVGINLQGNLLFPVEWGGVYVGGGTGGVSGGASVSTTTVIGGFSGGLIFRLGDRSTTTSSRDL